MIGISFYRLKGVVILKLSENEMLAKCNVNVKHMGAHGTWVHMGAHGPLLVKASRSL